MWSRECRVGDVIVIGEARLVVQELADGKVRVLIDAPLHVYVRRCLPDLSAGSTGAVEDHAAARSSPGVPGPGR